MKTTAQTVVLNAAAAEVAGRQKARHSRSAKRTGPGPGLWLGGFIILVLLGKACGGGPQERIVYVPVSPDAASTLEIPR